MCSRYEWMCTQPSYSSSSSSGVQQHVLLRCYALLQAAHADLFPIDYEDNFFIRATHGLDRSAAATAAYMLAIALQRQRVPTAAAMCVPVATHTDHHLHTPLPPCRIWSCAAVSTATYGAEQLVGFITAKLVFLHEVDASVRHSRPWGRGRGPAAGQCGKSAPSFQTGRHQLDTLCSGMCPLLPVCYLCTNRRPAASPCVSWHRCPPDQKTSTGPSAHGPAECCAGPRPRAVHHDTGCAGGPKAQGTGQHTHIHRLPACIREQVGAAASVAMHIQSWFVRPRPRRQGSTAMPGPRVQSRWDSCLHVGSILRCGLPLRGVLCCAVARCRAVFLHVITYNTAAMSLYSRQGFSCVAKLRAFYYIATGRTPDPQQQVREAPSGWGIA